MTHILWILIRHSLSQDGATALIIASYNGHSIVVRKLLQAEATVNTTTKVNKSYWGPHQLSRYFTNTSVSQRNNKALKPEETIERMLKNWDNTSPHSHFTAKNIPIQNTALAVNQHADHKFEELKKFAQSWNMIWAWIDKRASLWNVTLLKWNVLIWLQWYVAVVIFYMIVSQVRSIVAFITHENTWLYAVKVPLRLYYVKYCTRVWSSG